MSTRVSRAPENALVTQLTSIRTDLDTLKAAQRVGGANLVGYLINSGASYDQSFTIAGSGRLNYNIAFSGAAVSYPPLASLYLYYALTSNVLPNAIPPYANGPAVSMNVQELPLSGMTSQWYASFWNNTGSSQTVYMKLIVSATGAGTWTITAA